MAKKSPKKHRQKDDRLPDIPVNPSCQGIPADHFPDIRVEVREGVPKRGEQYLRERLNCVDPHDLQGLACIRIVALETLYSYGSLSGCYWPASATRQAEIWLSSTLFMFGPILLKYAWLLHRDYLAETLFHEIGHHKAAQTPRVISKYKGEAYAEKYMFAYRTAWFRTQSLSRKWRVLLTSGLKIVRWMITPVAYLLGKKYLGAHDVYCYFTGQMTQAEYWEALKARMEAHGTSWEEPEQQRTHPLRQKKYREKFGIDPR